MVKAINAWRLRPDMKIGTSHGAKGSNKAADRGNAYHRKVFKLLEPCTTTPGFRLVVEPWLQEVNRGKFLQPDSVLIDDEASVGIVVEVKLNWKDGRDDKLINKYLPAVRAAFGLELVWPLLITQDLRGYQHPPLLGLPAIIDAMAWTPAAPTPVLLLP